MIAAALVAAAVLAPSGGAAGIQAYPVCVPAAVQPGRSYPLTVYVSGGSLTLTVTPAHGWPENSLHQVPPSWVSFASAGPGRVPLTLTVPGDAAPGAYWSDIRGGTQGQPGGGVSDQAAATVPLVFTVGSSAAPPPCDALTLGYSTGRFPAWPDPEFATTGWPQVFARERASEPRPLLSPTAGTGVSAAPAVPAAAYSPAANAAPAASPQGHLLKIPADWIGWAILIGLFLITFAGLRRWLRS